MGHLSQFCPNGEGEISTFTTVAKVKMGPSFILPCEQNNAIVLLMLASSNNASAAR